jgi:hypothetical protein
LPARANRTSLSFGAKMVGLTRDAHITREPTGGRIDPQTGGDTQGIGANFGHETSSGVEILRTPVLTNSNQKSSRLSENSGRTPSARL